MGAFEGIVNVKDFGAIGDGTYRKLSEQFSSISEAQASFASFPSLAKEIKNLDQTLDWAGIQAAIFKAFETGAGMVFVPGGEYKISSPGLIIPRYRNQPVKKQPIRIVGAGADISVFSGLRDQDGVALAEFEAVIGFEEYQENTEGIAINRGLEQFGLENITVARSNKGRVFYYSDHNQEKLRFRNAVFRNVVFRSANYYRRDPCPDGKGLCGPWIEDKQTQSNCVEIHHGHQMIFDNVKISGGESGLYLRDCSRVTANMLHIDRDGACHTGIRLENGGTYYFSGLRIEGCPNGSGFSARGVEDQLLKNILIDGISFESKGEKYMITLDSVVGCNIHNMSLGTTPAVLCPENTPVYGLYIGNNTANISVQGTLGSPLAKHCSPESRTIFVHRNAKFVRLTDIQIVDADLNDLARDVEVEPGSAGTTRDVEVSVLLTENFDLLGRTERRTISA